MDVEAFGEEGAVLRVPAPLIRVTEGTTIVVSVRNELPTAPRVHGLCSRDGGACASLDVPPDATREVRFASGGAGTYHYWATSTGAPVPFRELGGALIVDPADDATARFAAARPGSRLINGRAWPATERLAYDVGDRVRWRVIKLSSQDAPMAGPDGGQIVTQVLRSGGPSAEARPGRRSCSAAASRSRSPWVNRLDEATSMHWHGLDLDRFYDGVHGWSRR